MYLAEDKKYEMWIWLIYFPVAVNCGASLVKGQIKVKTFCRNCLKNVTERLHRAFTVCFFFCLSLQGYEVRKITAIDQDLGRPRGIGYTIISGLSHIINLTSTESITSYHNPTAIIDKSHQVQQSITAESGASELENRPACKQLLITVWCGCVEVSRHLVLSFTSWLVSSKQDYHLSEWQI